MSAPPGRVRPAWPAWFGFAALAMAVLIAAIAGGLLLAILQAGSSNVNADSPGVNIGATLIQDLLLIGSALWLAARVAPPKPWQFGLRGTPFWRGVKWAAIAFAIYFVFQLVYIAAVHPDQKQTTLKDLGAGSSGLATLVIGILVVGLAPLAEEFFFRGFFYTSLRTRFPFLAAALIDGLVFGAVHAPTGIEAVPPLIVLGIAFCVSYEATGSIIPGVILHGLNNMVAFGSDKDGSWPVAGVVAAALIAACILGPVLARSPRTAPG
jgi:membrane protease YdiL (CAAX protease family)